MSSGAGLLLDPQPYTFAAEGATLLAPCMSVVLFLDESDHAGVQEWHDRGLDALGGALTHYRALEMGTRARVNARARGLLASWIARPSPDKDYHLEFYGCPVDQGVTAAGLSVDWVGRTWADKPPARRARWMETWRTMAAQGKDVRRWLPATVLRLTLPLDHPLAAPDALVAWVHALRLVRTGRFASGYAALALTFDPYASGTYRPRAADERLAALCLRHPGFDWHDTFAVNRRMLPYEPALHDHLPLVKRANWLTLLSARTIGWLGGEATLTATLAASAALGVAVDRLDGGALAVRAGTAPAVGDVVGGHVLPAYRAVARAVRAARLDEIDGVGEGFPEARAQEWLDAFDADPDRAT